MVKANASGSYVLTAGEDGLLFVHKLNAPAMARLAEYYATHTAEDMKMEEVETILKAEFPKDARTVDHLELDKSVRLAEGSLNVDVEEGALSLQETKLRSEEDTKQKKAEKKKEIMRAEVTRLREQYEKIVKARLGDAQAPAKEFDDVTNVDQEYFAELSKEIDAQMKDVYQELDYEKAKHKVAVDKLRREYLDPLDYNTVMLKGIKSHAFVRTFRLRKLPQFVEDAYREQEELAQMETKKDKLDTTEESVDTPAKGGMSPMVGTHTMFKCTQLSEAMCSQGHDLPPRTREGERDQKDHRRA
jgi:hypothetical protein